MINAKAVDLSAIIDSIGKMLPFLFSFEYIRIIYKDAVYVVADSHFECVSLVDFLIC